MLEKMVLNIRHDLETVNFRLQAFVFLTICPGELRPNSLTVPDVNTNAEEYSGEHECCLYAGIAISSDSQRATVFRILLGP